jgi:hypothetical protein
MNMAPIPEAHAIDRRLAKAFQAMTAAPCNDHGNHGGEYQRDLVGPRGPRVPEQVKRQADQQDEAGDRDDRLDQRQRAGILVPGHSSIS